MNNNFNLSKWNVQDNNFFNKYLKKNTKKDNIVNIVAKNKKNNIPIETKVLSNNTLNIVSNIFSNEINTIKKDMGRVIDLYYSFSDNIRIFILILFIILTYLFLMYNLYISILFSIISFILLLPYSIVIGITYIIVYIIIILNKLYERNKTYGKPIEQTIVKKNECYNGCISDTFIIEYKNLPSYGNGNFTYSFWLYLDSIGESNISNFRNDVEKCIFYRGTYTNEDDSSLLVDINLNNENIILPGIFLDTNNYIIIRLKNNENIENYELRNIDYNRWINITFTITTNSISIYTDGKLEWTKRFQSDLIYKGNEYDLYVFGDDKESTDLKRSGYAGKLAYLILYDYCLKPSEVYTVYNNYKKYLEQYELNNISINSVYPTLIRK